MGLAELLLASYIFTILSEIGETDRQMVAERERARERESERERARKKKQRKRDEIWFN